MALWGDSYTGGQVVVVGAVDRRARAIVAQCPAFGAEPPTIEASPANLGVIRDILDRGDVRGSAGTTSGPLPVVSFDQDGTPSLFKPIQVFRWFIDYGGRPGTHRVNRVTRVIPDTPVPYHPMLCAPFVEVPTLSMVAPEDEMMHANYAVARRTCDLLPGPKRWHDIAGSHFGLLYHPGALFDEASGAQIDFLTKWL